MSKPVVLPEASGPSAGTERWMVMIYNNDHNTFDEVIEVLIVATGCDYEEAAIEAWEAHHFGRAPVHFSTQPECEDVASTIASIGLRTEVCKEWNE